MGSRYRVRPTVNIPSPNMPQRIIFFFSGNWTWMKIGRGMAMIMRSDEILKKALVIK